MFFEKLTQMLSNAFKPKPRYITVTPVTESGPVAALPPATMPRHVAIIMDGNGRWARQRNLPRSAGHAAGTEALRDIIRASDDWGIEALSLYAFSTENWARSKDEVEALMGLLLKYFASEIDELDEKNVRITILGDVDGLPGPQREAVLNAMARTRNNDGLKLNIALNYGGRAELTRAARILARQARDGVIEPEDITEEMFAEELYTADSPDVDLLIRTSGEQRTSNFLPWQLTYAEFIFDNTYWPDFTRERYMKCLREYAGRERRFGREDATTEAPKAEPQPAAASEAREAEEDIVLEVKPVIAPAAHEPEPVKEPEAVEVSDIPEEPDAEEPESVEEDFVLEVKPVIVPAKPEPKVVKEPVAVEASEVSEEPEAEEPESVEEDFVLEVKPVLDPVKPEARPEPQPAPVPTEDADAVPEDFVLEITPVLSPGPEPSKEGGGAAPGGKGTGKKPRSRSRKNKSRAAAQGKPEGTANPDEPAKE